MLALRGMVMLWQPLVTSLITQEDLANHTMITSSTTALRDASGRLQGFITRGSSGLTVLDTKGHHTGCIDNDGKTRDVLMNILSFQPRLDLISPARSNTGK